MEGHLRESVPAASGPMTASSATFRVGTSGYEYEHWRGCFYPEDLPRKDWLAFYGRQFEVVEINYSFYRLPDSTTFDHWRKQVPEGFLYALKFSRYGSHLKCLKDPAGTIGAFLSPAKHLEDRLGPILVQLKPQWKVDVSRLRRFLERTSGKQRWALEFRERSWLCDEVFDLLQQHNTALCIHDLLDDHPREVTADWVYLRFHGKRYQGSYSPQFLTAQARWIADRLAQRLDTFAFFNNDAEGHAVRNAASLREYVRSAQG